MIELLCDANVKMDRAPRCVVRAAIEILANAASKHASVGIVRHD
jgi:hypothetical protein